MLSALPPIATEWLTSLDGSFVPIAAREQLQQSNALFDHLVGAGEQPGRHGADLIDDAGALAHQRAQP
jgi:hypothetical protein